MVLYPCDGLTNCPGCDPAHLPVSAEIGTALPRDPHVEDKAVEMDGLTLTNLKTPHADMDSPHRKAGIWTRNLVGVRKQTHKYAIRSTS